MPAAMKLYREMGFEPTPRYKNDHSVAETAFLRLELSPPRPDEANSLSEVNCESV